MDGCAMAPRLTWSPYATGAVNSLSPVKSKSAPAPARSRQWRFDFLQFPLVLRYLMAVVAIKTIVEDMLKQAGALSAHDRVSGNRPEIAVRMAASTDPQLPFPLGIICGAGQENLRADAIDSVRCLVGLQ